jgi:hypothetical protein
MATPADIKKALQQAGFEVYRTRGDVVHVAERVRENLLMDSGVSIDSSRLAVAFVVRAQLADFPGASQDELFARARGLGGEARERGYHEIEARVSTIPDPVDDAATLDTWFEVVFEKAAAQVGAALDEVRFALGLEKAAQRR